MTIKQRALKDVVLLVVYGATVGAVTTIAIGYWGLTVVGTILAGTVLIYLCKTAYDIRVTQLKWEQERIERALKEGR
jgi:uncharacterized membrane protein YoaK (UPF0700 family)